MKLFQRRNVYYWTNCYDATGTNKYLCIIHDSLVILFAIGQLVDCKLSISTAVKVCQYIAEAYKRNVKFNDI